MALAQDQPTYRILVVEDQLEHREPLVQLLQSVGYEVQEAVNGQEALTQNRAWQPHLILMDLHMPLLSGFETTQLIKAEDPHPPIIIALTAQAFVEGDAIAAGCDDFVQKPNLVEEIFHKLAEHLGATYCYKNLEQQNISDSAQDKLKAEHLVVMPHSWIQRVHSESVQLDYDALIRLFTEIPLEQQTLHSTLQLLTEGYRFDIIINATQEALRTSKGI